MHKFLVALCLLSSSHHLFSQQHKLRISKLDEHVYVHTSFKDLAGKPFPSNGLIVETSSSVVIIDTPWDIPQTEQLLKWVKKKIKKPVSHCIVTHAHDDRISGIPALKKMNVKIASIQLTADKIAAEGYPLPDIILPADTLFTVHDQSFQTYFPGHGHAPDNIVVWLAEQKILFGGCFIKSTQSFGLGNVADANVDEWKNSISRVKQKFSGAAVIIPGHQQWHDASAMDYTLELLKKQETKGN